LDQTLRYWLETSVVAAHASELVIIDKSKIERGGKKGGFASIVVSRFDRLSSDIQIVLKMAAVLGRLPLFFRHARRMCTNAERDFSLNLN
jgi:hypothetical protein